jgi:hypothetical protein
MPTCPECGTTLSVPLCTPGERPVFFRCMLCRAVFLTIGGRSSTQPLVFSPAEDRTHSARPS